MTQVVNSLIPIAVIQTIYGTIKNVEVDLIAGKFSPKEPPTPNKVKPSAGMTLVPANCNEWTIITIDGPKRIG